MKISVCLQHIFIDMALVLFWFVSAAHAEMASVYADAMVIAEVAQPMGSE